MKKTMQALTMVALVIAITGCATNLGFSAGPANAGVHARVHGWETPNFKADLNSNPVSSELGLGFVTVGSHAGLGDHPTGQWVSLGVTVGPTGGGDGS